MDIAIKTSVRQANVAAIRDAAAILRDGGLVAFPTETVYGLGADAANGRAVAKIFEAKGRPRFNPLIVHVRDLNQACEYAGVSAAANKLAEAFWPGPLTLVLPRLRTCRLSALVSAGLDTVALRVPAHTVALELLAASGVPIAAPSANRSGGISATRAEHVRRDLTGKVELILDGGAAALGIESTVVGFDGNLPVLLRAGAVPRGVIEKVVGPLAKPTNSDLRSPGQLSSHYSPHVPVRLNAKSVHADEALLAFGPGAPMDAHFTLNLSASADMKEAASNLFAMLHALDDNGQPIAVMPIPEYGLGEAINDRLRRAAAASAVP